MKEQKKSASSLLVLLNKSKSSSDEEDEGSQVLHQILISFELTLVDRIIFLSIRTTYFLHSFDAWLCEAIAQSSQRLLGTQLSVDDVLLEWRRMWHQAHAEIIERFQQQPQLRSLVFDIEHTPFNSLKQFLAPDYTLVGEQLPRSGKG